jgi:hypothetical protein
MLPGLCRGLPRRKPKEAKEGSHWSGLCMSKVKFFGWLLLSDRLDTRKILRRKKHLDESYTCVWHDDIEEIAMRLFFECTSSVTRWFMLGIQWNVHKREQLQLPLFMDLFRIAAFHRSVRYHYEISITNGRTPQ